MRPTNMAVMDLHGPKAIFIFFFNIVTENISNLKTWLICLWYPHLYAQTTFSLTLALEYPIVC